MSRNGLTSACRIATLCSATMFSAKRPRKPLSELEHLVMDVLWKRRQTTAEDVRDALAKRHPMKESTSRTILKRLEEKGYVKHRVEGRTNVYQVSEQPRSLAVTAVKQIIDRLCGGSVEQLIVGMVVQRPFKAGCACGMRISKIAHERNKIRVILFRF